MIRGCGDVQDFDVVGRIKELCVSRSWTYYRLAKMSPVAPEMIRRIDQAMHEKVLAVNTSAADHMDGRNALSEILKRMSPSAEQSILDSLATQDPELGPVLDQALAQDLKHYAISVRPVSE